MAGLRPGQPLLCRLLVGVGDPADDGVLSRETRVKASRDEQGRN
jgi:hypothetical protein